MDRKPRHDPEERWNHASASSPSGCAISSAPEQVDALLTEVERGGGRIAKPAGQAEWGGRTGYFADPDGFLGEVAWNPRFPHV